MLSPVLPARGGCRQAAGAGHGPAISRAEQLRPGQDPRGLGRDHAGDGRPVPGKLAY